MLHHNDPYLKLGPFKLEFLLSNPMRTIFHDFMTEAEMKYLVDYSAPRLSNAREIPSYNSQHNKADVKEGKKGRTVSKTNQVQMKYKSRTAQTVPPTKRDLCKKLQKNPNKFLVCL